PTVAFSFAIFQVVAELASFQVIHVELLGDGLDLPDITLPAHLTIYWTQAWARTLRHSTAGCQPAHSGKPMSLSNSVKRRSERRPARDGRKPGESRGLARAPFVPRRSPGRTGAPRCTPRQARTSWVPRAAPTPYLVA